MVIDCELPKAFKLPSEPKGSGFDPFKAWVVILIIALFYIFCFCSCSTFSSSPQPKWVPIMYVPVNGGCMFQNAEDPTDTVMGGDLKMLGMYLTPIDEIKMVQSIMQRCESWR